MSTYDQIDNQQRQRIDELFENGILSAEDFRALIDGRDENTASYLSQKARIRQKEYLDRKSVV